MKNSTNNVDNINYFKIYKIMDESEYDNEIYHQYVASLDALL
jgi:hypothetical protein